MSQRVSMYNSDGGGGGSAGKETVKGLVAVGLAAVRGVRVWNGKAEVRREARVRLPRGAVAVQLYRFPSGLIRDSIRVEVKGARLRYTSFDEKEERLIPDSQLHDVAKTISTMRRQVAELEIQAKQVGDQRTLWNKAAEGLRGANASGVPDLSALKAFDSAFKTATDSLKTEEVKTKDALAELSSRQQKTEDEAQEIRSSTAAVRLTAHLDVKEDEVELEITYLVNGADWRPHYEVKLDTHSKKLQIKYWAAVKQSSGEDWEDAKLSVSSGDGSGVGKMPLQRGLFVVQRMGPEEQGVDPNPARLLNLNYDIPGRKRVGNGAETRVLVTEMELEPAVETFVIPKESLTAFTRCRTQLRSAYTLLPGSVLLMQDTTIVGREELRRVVHPKEEFVFPMGPEPCVRVEYGSQESAEKGQNRHRRHTRALINVKNKGQSRLRLTVLEQVPISRIPNSPIKVSVVKPVLNTPSRPTDPVKLNRFNYMEWTLDLGSDEAKDLETEILIDHPPNIEPIFHNA